MVVSRREGARQAGGGGCCVGRGKEEGSSCVGECDTLSKTIPVCFEELCGVAPLSGMIDVMVDNKGLIELHSRKH
jgi:hypothetical protein